MNSTLRKLRLAVVAAALSLVQSTPVVACAVCFGDPDSPMVKGALAGMIVLVGVISFVLMGVVGTGLYWNHRSRRLTLGDDAAPQSDR